MGGSRGKRQRPPRLAIIDKSGKPLKDTELMLSVEDLKRRYPVTEAPCGELTEQQECRLLGEFLKDAPEKYPECMERARRHVRDRTGLDFGQVMKGDGISHELEWKDTGPERPDGSRPGKTVKKPRDPQEHLQTEFLKEVFYSELRKAGVYEEHRFDRRLDLSDRQFDERMRVSSARLRRIRRAYAEGELPLEVVEQILLTDALALLGDSGCAPVILKGYGDRLGPIARAIALEHAAVYEAILPLATAFEEVSAKVRKGMGKLTEKNIKEYSKAFVRIAHGDPSKDEIAQGIVKFADDAERIHRTARRIRKKPSAEL